MRINFSSSYHALFKRLSQAYILTVQQSCLTGLSSLHSRRQQQKCKIKVSIRADRSVGRAWDQDNRKKKSQTMNVIFEGI